jgi:hypothetical protein
MDMISAITVEEQNLIKGIREHSIANYEKDGWDCIEECWTDAEIASFLRENKISSLNEAITKLGEQVKWMDDHRKDIMATAF